LYVWRTGYVGVTIKSAPLRLMITFIFDMRLLRRLKHNVSLGFFYRMKIGITFYFTVYSFHFQQFQDAYPFIWLKWNRRRDALIGWFIEFIRCPFIWRQWQDLVILFFYIRWWLVILSNSLLRRHVCSIQFCVIRNVD
jgi:hypothetical protein